MFKTRQQVANEYGISRKTLYRKLKKYGITLASQGLLSPEQQQMIYRHMGNPHRPGGKVSTPQNDWTNP
jgi:transcriptional antiterminator